MSNENVAPQPVEKRPHDESALIQPPRKKIKPANAWKSKGHYIGCSIHAFTNFAQLVLVGMQIDKELSLLPDNGIEKYSAENRLRHNLYTQILRSLPDLEEGIEKRTISASELNSICASIQEGANAACSDDVKGLKGPLLDWIADPVKGLVPPIPRNQMSPRGFNHEVTGKYLCPAGLDWNDAEIRSGLQEGTMVVLSDQWPIFLYSDGVYDPENAWNGLLRGHLLINAFKHVFTSPSSIDNSGRATKGSNSYIHGMETVTIASIVYIATLVRFALGDRSTFSRTDTVMDSQNFYNVLLAFLSHPEELEDVNALLKWWNMQVFPNSVTILRAPTANSPLARLMAKRKNKRAPLQVTGTNCNNSS